MEIGLVEKCSFYYKRFYIIVRLGYYRVFYFFNWVWYEIFRGVFRLFKLLIFYKYLNKYINCVV